MTLPMLSFKLCYALTEVNKYQTGVSDGPRYRNSAWEPQRPNALPSEAARRESPKEILQEHKQVLDLSISPSVPCGFL